MVELPGRVKMRLEPQDEYMHDPGTASNYNESMYLNVFDAEQKIGGWFRIGNRPNEGYAEMTVCLYLPHGEVAFMYAKPKITGNDKLEAGGLSIRVVEPFKRLDLSYRGRVARLKNPGDMAEPARAFKTNPVVPAEVDITFTGVSPMFGGEAVNEDGSAIAVKDPTKSFAKAHYEQHVAGEGTFVVGDDRYTVRGHGLRDKSWGPRYWQAIHWYRWLPMNFGPDFAMMISVIADDAGNQRTGGMVLKDGAYDLIRTVTMSSTYDADFYQTALEAKVTTHGGATYDVTGRVVSLIPLRNRRTAPDGTEMNTRITEGMTEYRCNGQVGYGMSEYLDQVVDGRPVGAGTC
ncbi:DUF7064 domain-containing protein [Zavarzinia sp. CC-PAN008]|uniref:DUF7064 domain-containing protein n=1 Tax=Zavarzinia sp. CC-PAN008 TaxID=3243332 RepID=UPI003F747FE6